MADRKQRVMVGMDTDIFFKGLPPVTHFLQPTSCLDYLSIKTSNYESINGFMDSFIRSEPSLPSHLPKASPLNIALGTKLLSLMSRPHIQTT
jgi:hypothetical protein